MAEIDNKDEWPPALLVPYLERKIVQLLPASETKISIIRTHKEDQEVTVNNSIRELFGAGATLKHRPDGKPGISGIGSGDIPISISHAGDITLLASAVQNIGCDLEKIVCQPSACWEQLLGAEEFILARLLSREANISLDIAATQVWTLKESLRKAGASFGQALSLSAHSADGWANFSSGTFTAATFHTKIKDTDAAYAFGFVLQSKP